MVTLAEGASNDDGRRPGAGEVTTGAATEEEDNKYMDRGVPVPPPPPTELAPPPGSATGCCCGVLGVTSIRGGCCDMVACTHTHTHTNTNPFFNQTRIVTVRVKGLVF